MCAKSLRTQRFLELLSLLLVCLAALPQVLEPLCTQRFFVFCLLLLLLLLCRAALAHVPKSLRFFGGLGAAWRSEPDPPDQAEIGAALVLGTALPRTPGARMT